ncbi:NKG2-C type II integral membrane protein [Camelus dromedarius]|uniref:NKG2-C type II integral membrane protein n=1 Tax=Camelus dromedarius TaxID=9838 RepID=A0A5N4C6K7_CAMDR|nr:NKG2-C type II integral membrane protein [Camelus dromedarius]
MQDSSLRKVNFLNYCLHHVYLSVSISLPAESPSPPEKLIAEILGILCFVLMYIIVKMIAVTPCKLLQFFLGIITPEQNNSSPVTRLQKELLPNQVTDSSPDERNCAMLNPSGVRSDSVEFLHIYNCKHKLEN